MKKFLALIIALTILLAVTPSYGKAASTYKVKSKYGLTFSLDSQLKEKITFSEEVKNYAFFGTKEGANLGHVDFVSYKEGLRALELNGGTNFPYYKLNKSKTKMYLYQSGFDIDAKQHLSTKNYNKYLKLKVLLEKSLLQSNGFLVYTQDVTVSEMKNKYHEYGFEVAQRMEKYMNTYLTQLEKKRKANPNKMSWNSYVNTLNKKYKKEEYATGLPTRQFPMPHSLYENVDDIIGSMNTLMNPISDSSYKVYGFEKIDLEIIKAKKRLSQLQKDLSEYKKYKK